MYVSPRPCTGRTQLLFLIALCALVATGCKSAANFTPEPLHPSDLLEQLTVERDAPAASKSGMTLANAASALRQTNPRIREARASHFAAAHVAKVKVPYPNPEVALGPMLFSTGDVLSSATWTLVSALGWQVLLVDTPELKNDINAERANRALVNAAVVERLEYLALRGEFLAAGIAARRLDLHERLGEQATTIAGVANELIESGAASATDARLIALDADRVSVDVIESSERAVDTRTELGARIGRGVDQIVPPADDALPPLPDTVPSTEVLFEIAVRQHPELDQIRAEYRVTEKELRLELARRIPDFFVNAAYEGQDDGSYQAGFPFAIEVPINDRNQPGIAEKHADRIRLRADFRARSMELLSAIEIAHRRVERRLARLKQLDEVVVPRTLETLEATRTAVETGTTDALRYIDVLRTEREVALERIDAEGDLLEAWSQLEQAVGAPLLLFPYEPVMLFQPADPAVVGGDR